MSIAPRPAAAAGTPLRAAPWPGPPPPACRGGAGAATGPRCMNCAAGVSVASGRAAAAHVCVRAGAAALHELPHCAAPINHTFMDSVREDSVGLAMAADSPARERVTCLIAEILMTSAPVRVALRCRAPLPHEKVADVIVQPVPAEQHIVLTNPFTGEETRSIYENVFGWET